MSRLRNFFKKLKIAFSEKENVPCETIEQTKKPNYKIIQIIPAVGYHAKYRKHHWSCTVGKPPKFSDATIFDSVPLTCWAIIEEEGGARKVVGMVIKNIKGEDVNIVANDHDYLENSEQFLGYEVTENLPL